MCELNIIAIHEVKPEWVKEYQQAALKVRNESRKEAGCIRYELSLDTNNQHIFIFSEIWANQAAMEFHNTTAHFMEFKQFLENKLVDRKWYKTKKF
ncbi:antibiotic biosynthesis monooxygenase [Gilliamella sp. B2717]|uniref:putative quinol monooxygenase n=1 Tax=Gilliamella sp. B2717 TaxID=2817996 RepID=UPI00226A1DCF|nr:putative quinol monooxygenase [Gilliamella sp. B2717]MCX8579425.1 antibiotic biosynthesis monooxygenase [Gilliamella sp. B2717]